MDLFELNGRVVVNLADALKAFDEIQREGQKTESKLSKFFSGVGKGALAVGKTVGIGLAAAGTAVTGLVTSATSAYAEYEQLVGGVDTLFKESSAKVQAYAEKAYQSAGMSANEYMDTVTSFAASLLQSLGGDTEKAADKADVAIRDMSDNANKMGTSMQMIQNAYQGFAKQNYTMLDNLKLGYGGTKEEMQRLLADAEKLSGQKFDISSYGDIVDAIHIVQTEMGITGTTAAEASGTITGSLSSVKGAWKNLTVAMASDNLPFGEYMDNFITSASAALENFMPRIGMALQGVGKLIKQLAPVIARELPKLAKDILPSLVSAAASLLISLAQALPALAMVLVEQIPIIVDSIKQALLEKFPELEEPFAFLEGMFNGVWQAMKTLWNSAGKPIFESICKIFASVKTALQPLIDAFYEYVTSGEFVNDITTVVSTASEVLAGAFDYLEGLVTGIVEGYQAMVTWGKENETALTLIGIAVGTLTAAIVAYNVAMAIKNAGGIVELAQLAATAIGVAALTVAETAHTIATTVATVATTAFGAALSFLTSPITLVILAIGALIAIVVLCVKHWDDIKKAGAKAWEWIKNAWSKAGEWFAGVWENIKNAFSSVGTWFKDIFTKAWNGVKNVFSGVKSFFTGIWGTIKEVFSGLGTKIADSISGAVKKGINGLIGGAENIINGFFKMVNGAIDMINEIPGVEITKIKLVEFARLAKGGVVNKPTPAIFGEDGAEAVVPLENNTGWINRVAAQLHQFSLETKGDFGGAFSTKMVELQGQGVSEMRSLNDKVDTVIDLLTRYFPDLIQAILTDKKVDIGKRRFARLVKETI